MYFMELTLVVDKAGRVVLPKRLRERMHLKAGDTLELTDDLAGDSLTLRPVRPQASLRKEMGVWVYQGEMPADLDIEEFMEHEREKRLRDLAG